VSINKLGHIVCDALFDLLSANDKNERVGLFPVLKPNDLSTLRRSAAWAVYENVVNLRTNFEICVALPCRPAINLYVRLDGH
jgi:hypothetical protein